MIDIDNYYSNIIKEYGNLSIGFDENIGRPGVGKLSLNKIFSTNLYKLHHFGEVLELFHLYDKN
jgi:hypothetical protein